MLRFPNLQRATSQVDDISYYHKQQQCQILADETNYKKSGEIIRTLEWFILRS